MLFRWNARAFVGIFIVGVASFTLLNVVVRAMEQRTSTTSHNRSHRGDLVVIPEDTFNYSAVKGVNILMWDGGNPFGWGGGQIIDPPNYGGFRYEKETCPVSCSFTTDRNQLPSADSILFDPCLTGPDGFRDIPVYMPDKLPGQQWGWFTYEQLNYFPMMQEREYMDRFDYKMMYHHDSQVQITFACPWAGFKDLLKPPPPKDPKKLVAFFASNCETGGAKKRTAYVQELMQYIDVHSYGACLYNRGGEWGRGGNGDNMKEKIETISEYKFLLAFENNNEVNDYVTEKLINAFQAGTVPIYWGAPNVDRWAIGPNSIIKASDYPSPKALAEYLTRLNENDDEYNKYFEWKQTGISPSFKRLWDNCLFFAECRLCKYIARQRSLADNYRPPEMPKSGVVGYALRVNGLDTDLYNDDDYVEVKHHASLDLTSTYTLMAWVKMEMFFDGRIIDKNEAGQIVGYELDIVETKTSPNKGHLRLCAAGGCYYSARTLSAGFWYHVAATFGKDGSKFVIKFYINGKFDSEHNPITSTNTNKLPMRFGRAAVGGGSWRPHHAATIFDGTLDEISIWGRTMEEREIFKWMFSRPTGKESGLVGWWGFNEGQGSTVSDIGPHKNHGTIRGHPTWVVSVSKPVLDPSNLEQRH